MDLQRRDVLQDIRAGALDKWTYPHLNQNFVALLVICVIKPYYVFLLKK